MIGLGLLIMCLVMIWGGLISALYEKFAIIGPNKCVLSHVRL